MDKFRSMEYAERAIAQIDCSEETKEFLKKVLRLEHNAFDPSKIVKNDYFRILVEISDKKAAKR